MLYEVITIKPKGSFPTSWKTILTQKVNYYNQLDNNEKLEFEYRVNEFLQNCRIIGVEVDVSYNFV